MKTRQNSKIYEIGTCFFCMKCMYCGKITCNCDKSIKPSNKNRTNDVKYYRGCVHSLDDNNGNEFYTKKVLESVEKFEYKLDLNKKFHYTICSSCNGKAYRENLKNSKKINQKSSNASSLPISNPSSIPTTPSTTFNDLSISETEELSLLDSSDIFNSSATSLPTSSISPSPTPTSPIPTSPISTFSPTSSKDQFKFKLQIKNNNNTSSQPSSLIVMEEKPFDILEFKEKICENLDERYGLLNYGEFKMIYKTENSNGSGNWLNNDDEFNEFLNCYEKLKKTTKMILVIVNVQSKRKVSF